MLAIIDYGVGNLASIRNMFKKIGAEALVTNDIGKIREAQKILLPGVGAFDHCMTLFNASGLREIVTRKALEEATPTIGICVGLQMLMEGSEEGKEPGLGWIKGRTVRFRQDQLGNLKVPHMGWTSVRSCKTSGLTGGFTEDTRFYFVHSYHVQVADPRDELIAAEYGTQFTAGVERGNILGVQFHPEKSHRFGMQLLNNFVRSY
ncbi:MAG TPA: imidazole glycerol phosphate synthase subunit HisH [Puia sp.]|nr:imidazole glycerol phosphate synthase subunit HisH [Puia sp.]